MEMLNLSLPANNRFATEYLAQKQEIIQFFHYRYQEIPAYKERLDELKKRNFKRHELAQHIRHFMEPFPSSQKVQMSLEKLMDENSVAVIGGQQAGVLTGPLYTLHKVISIIVLAEQKEKELGVPVVPVFWIAGEDHDYLEVNHIYMEMDNKIQKLTYPEVITDKRMVSDCLINKEKCYSWVEKIIESFGETNFTKDLIQFANEAIEKSKTLVDFFAHIIMELFKESGLLIIDSGNKELRQLEKEYFIRQIKDWRKITDLVIEQQKILNESGFGKSIEIHDQTANLFYYDELTNSRILLEYENETALFIGKNGTLQFTYDELLKLSEEQPERLSNNVVTRPLMQEWLFPTLAFIGGPGEIAYWSELKLAFENFELKMPPIVPRLNITLLERSVETDIQELGWALEVVLRNGINHYKESFIDSVRDPELTDVFSRLREDLTFHYQAIARKSEVIDKGLNPVIKKNEAILLKQIRFIEEKIDTSVQLKFDVLLRKMDRVGNALRPNNAPQERVLNLFYFLNKYGLDFVEKLVSLDYRFDGKHKVIKI
jgi:bacillithiol synthase